LTKSLSPENSNYRQETPLSVPSTCETRTRRLKSNLISRESQSKFVFDDLLQENTLSKELLQENTLSVPSTTETKRLINSWFTKESKSKTGFDN
jgi:hypothetical protein